MVSGDPRERLLLKSREDVWLRDADREAEAGLGPSRQPGSGSLGLCFDESAGGERCL